MHRSFFILAAAAAVACGDASLTGAEGESVSAQSAVQALGQAGVAAGASVSDVTRDHVVDDVFHYSFVVRVGPTANAKLRLHRIVRERAGWAPRPTASAVMLLHGDFSTFATNFAPSLGAPPRAGSGLAVFLARRGVDVWGFDRRWTQAPALDPDLSDFDGMGIAAEVDDVGRALAIARAGRAITGAGDERMTLVGFSRGGLLAYTYAAVEAARPPAERHVKGLVPLDVYAEIAPWDAALKQRACAGRDEQRDLLARGTVDSDNGFFIELGSLARSAPDDVSPLFPGRTNRTALFEFVGQTYEFYPVTALYHLMAGVLSDGAVTALREAPEAAASAWLAGAAPHQPIREAYDSDTIWCGEGPLPVSAPLSRIRVPLFYLGAAGGFGDHGLYSTTRVRSSDVTTRVVRRFGADREAVDFGHADLLYARDAQALAWEPLAAWIARH